MERNEIMSHTTEAITDEGYVSDDVQAIAEYRSVSVLAVLAAVLGVASASAIVTSSLLLIPLLGIIISLFALWRIAHSDGQQVGRTLALVGLALSLAFGSGVYVRGMMLSRLLGAEAQDWALQWCDLVLDDQLITALELTVAPNSRRPFNDALESFYSTDEAAKKRLDEFENDDVIKALRDAPEGSKVVAGDVMAVASYDMGSYVVVQKFELVPPRGEGNPIRFRLQARRVRLGGIGGNAWYLMERTMGWD